MSPLILVGITLLTSVLADVSHVLQGQAQPPTDPHEINGAFAEKTSKDFWWMQDDSPLKASYEYYKKCAATGKCPSGSIDLQKNVFLNGGIASSEGSASFSESVSASGGETESVHSDLSNNPFLKGQFAHAANGDLIRNENGFIGVQPRIPFKNNQKSRNDAVSGSKGCTGACVTKEECVNGVAKEGAPRSNGKSCAANEICCQLSGGKSTLADHINQLVFSPGKSKIAGKDGLTPEQVQIIHSGQEGIRIQPNAIGEFEGSSTIKPVRDVTAAGGPVFSSTPDYSDVHFGSEARFSNLDGLDYLPPVPGTLPTPKPPAPTCPPGQYVNNYGRCESIRTECPPGTRATPSGGCEKLKVECPPGQKPGSFGGCVPIPPPPPQCPPGQKLGPYGSCVPLPPPPTQPPTRPPPPQCPPGQKPGPYGGCVPLPPPPTRPPPPQCPPGQKQGPYGGCVPIAPPTTTEKPYCGAGEREGPNGQCIPIQKCRPGQRETPFGTCEDIATRPPPPQCPPGQKPGPYGGCIPPPPPPPTRPPPPQCPPGQKQGPYGGCVPIAPPTTTEKPYCGAGEREGPNGQCIPVARCKPGQRETPFGTCEDIATRPPPPQCPPGQKLGPYGTCISPPTQPPTRPPPPQCPPGQKPGPYGSCIPPPPPPTRPPPPQCPPGQKQGPYGGCVPIAPPTTTEKPYCGAGEREGPNGQCIPVARCKPGQRETPFGTCEDIATRPPPTRPPPPQCPPGQKLGPYGTCIPPPPPPTQPPTRPPPPQCPPGQKQGPYGGCVPIAPPTTTEKPYCGAGEREGPNGQCIPVVRCKPGQRETPFGTCEDIATRPPPTRPPQCPPGQKLGPYGSCQPITPSCGFGQRPSASGGCEDIPRTPITTEQPEKPYCGAGEREGPNGQCIKIETCPPGYTQGPFGQCIPPPTQPPTRPPSPQCPQGQKPGPYGGCVPVQPPTPPPTRPTTKYCASGQRVGPNGECIDVTPAPSCGPGQKLGPYGGCIDITRPTPAPRPTCPPGSFPTASGGCQRPPPPPPPPTQAPTRTCPPGTVKSPSGRCESPPPPPRPITCPPGSYLGPSGTCVRPPPPSTTPGTYLPPKTPSSLTSPRPGYHYPTPTPKFTEGEDIYDVSEPDRTGEPDSHVPSYLRPSTNRPSTERPPRPTLPVRSPTNHTTGETQHDQDLIPVGCAAALKCVQEIYCTVDGFISPVPVVLTKEQELLRAPTTVCRDLESGTLGKCCRDKDYQDAWPSANLVDGVDDGQYAEDDSIGQYKAEYNRFSGSAKAKRSRTKRQTEECGVRNINSTPQGRIPIDADFAEISWQAMILRQSNQSLLCGGAIIAKNAVLTAAHCVEGLETSDILTKGGEWKLGIDEEPLPFQIVKVAAIARHPDFKAGNLQNDLAVLVLEENFRFTKNIGSICLPQPNLIPTQNCLATGWGKRILQLHAKNALMHKIDVNVMEVAQCQQVLNEHFTNMVPNYNTNTLCGFSNTDQCKVDYGSAMACADESGRYTLSGIYTWDTGCKQQGQIGGYVAPDVDWIDNVLATPIKTLKRFDREYNTARLQAVA
ncbi:nascent polypeptide-associated complex subunit alpha, muscle-specific form-like isoform X3 [Anthonomus grandis grandis]|uniref:nascent polypeptide-associated complex subunit alpha, muscle-specific form-like isoform X3 n=1 Tax=Anthonomus grandis grandis TaxID=2921223 RepID=UPI0021660838|nr:nascent polypeptide-associated complex subunit alpha, muscle-specific form-like isoform X3 [Anthonomus grandis grandis]